VLAKYVVLNPAEAVVPEKYAVGTSEKAFALEKCVVGEPAGAFVPENCVRGEFCQANRKKKRLLIRQPLFFNHEKTILTATHAVAAIQTFITSAASYGYMPAYIA